MQTNIASSARSQRGYNLIEVLIAMAVLGTVMLSVLTLFVLGRRNVYSGKQMTRISAVGTRVLEDLSVMAADDVMTNFNIIGTTTLATHTVAGTSYPASIKRTTSSFTTADDFGGYLAQWQSLLGSNVVSGGVVTLIITPSNPSSAASGDAITTAQSLRVTAIIEWREASRTRNAVYSASKLRRPAVNLTN